MTLLKTQTYTVDQCDVTQIHSDNPEDGSRHAVSLLQKGVASFCKKYGTYVWRGILVVILITYTVYLGLAIAHSVSKATPLIVLTSLTVAYVAYLFVKKHFGDYIYKNLFTPISDVFDRYWGCIKWWVSNLSHFVS